MKKTLLLFVAMVVAGFANAQYYSVSATQIGINPGNICQDEEQTAAYMLGNYTGYTQILNPGETNWSSTQSIPFTFEFDGQAVTSYSASPAGAITFSTPSGALSSSNVALPTSQIPDNSVCLWGLNLSGANDGVIVKTFGTAPRRQHWVIWASASYTGISGWTYWAIILEESTNHIYIADLRTYDTSGGNAALTVGVQIDSTEAYSLAASPSVPAVTTNGGSEATSVDNTYYLFGYGTQPTTDLDNIEVSNNYYVAVNEATSITGYVVNHGSANVTSAQISYTIDGGTAVNDNLTGLAIAPGTMYEFTLPTTWTTSNLGLATIATVVNESNGSSETITVNNAASKDVMVTPTPVVRKPLLEQFTSSTCAPCTPGNANVLSVLSNYSDLYSKTNYQMSWPGTGDPYFTLEGQDRRVFYGVNSVPSMHTDGSAGLNSNSFTAAIMDDALDVPSFMNLTVSGTIQPEYTYEVDNGALVKVDSAYHFAAQVDINPIIDMDAGMVAHIVINEDLTYNNEKTNGETEFHDVMKKMLPDAAGTSLSAVSANDSTSVTQTHTFPGMYRLSNDAGDPIVHSLEHSIEEWDDLRVVTWVQNPNTGEVWQSENAEVMMLEAIDNVEIDTVDGQVVYTVDGESYVMWDDMLAPLGVNEGVADLISVYPNPANDILNLSGVSGRSVVTILDASGRLVNKLVVENNSIDVSSLETGVYSFSIENNGVTKVEKVTIAH
ncbi:MAG: T9SS type A sorting domain-containing protein [Cryomorphaceae bacterium]